MKFSERYDYSPKKIIQKEQLNDVTKIKIWNIFRREMLQKIPTTLIRGFYQHLYKEDLSIFDLVNNYLNIPREDLPEEENDFLIYMKKYYFESLWYTLFDLLEWGFKSLKRTEREDYIKPLNQVLGEELVAYRMVDGKIVEITDNSEIEELENAIRNVENLTGVKEHLHTALELLAKKPTPDYRNSIKESISAVEAICSLINGRNETLGRALNAIKSKIGMDSHLEEGFKNIYTYTSDANGIRHALMDDPNLDIEDARFMLVSCATFINYLIVKANKANISIE